ncbi:MAG: ribbon-helix-helix protein, CopG family [Solirubrobacteraceae bacterium]
MSHPKAPGESKAPRRLYVTLDPAELAAIDAAAALEGISRADVLRRALRGRSRPLAATPRRMA